MLLQCGGRDRAGVHPFPRCAMALASSPHPSWPLTTLAESRRAVMEDGTFPSWTSPGDLLLAS
uniref:Uncharacterized protein n=1 Tax=Physcomitrium patens TaxID=3218 RepID=A0A2K1KT09_PHYPA|nr:hypothetical protein PHYPA_003910 [Physcomitrium patens]